MPSSPRPQVQYITTFTPLQLSAYIGKTKCINHFLINKKWYLVDLPGYGFVHQPSELRKFTSFRFSRVDKSKKVEWNQFTRDYFVQRGTLANVLLLIDASIPPLDLDLYCANWLGDSQVPFTVVFTKTDKRKSGTPVQNIQKFRDSLAQTWETLPVCFATSSRTGDGREALLRSELTPQAKLCVHGRHVGTSRGCVVSSRLPIVAHLVWADASARLISNRSATVKLETVRVLAASPRHVV